MAEAPRNEAAGAPERRFPWKPLLSWIGTLVLGGFVLSKTDLPGIARAAVQADLGLLGVAVGLYVLDRVTAAYRWRILYVAFGHPLGLWRATSVYLQSGFLGAALPATVGGDLIRAKMVATGTSTYPHALSSVVLERILGTLALVLVAALGLAIFQPHASWVAAIPSLAVTALVAATGVAMVYAPAVPRALLARAPRWGRPLASFLVELQERVRSYAQRPGALLLSTGIAFVQQYLFVFINWILVLAMDLPVGVASMLWMWPLVMLAVRLPISVLGFGVREAMLLEFFAGVGISPDAAVSLGLLSGLLDLLFIGIGGLLFVAGRPGVAVKGGPAGA